MGDKTTKVNKRIVLELRQGAILNPPLYSDAPGAKNWMAAVLGLPSFFTGCSRAAMRI